jgi:predicted regulator of Ras-like GTPase activity (Roadblock/LC7/MglB family)
MTDCFVQLLRTLRDVDGVIGSFIWTKTGSLLARDLPEAIDSARLAEVGPRLERLHEAFSSSGDEIELATLAFGEHKLHVRAVDRAFIAVLSAIPINMPTLRMALNLVGRRVSVELERLRPPATETAGD